MNKKWIVIPDVHGRRFWRDAVKGNETERIIFLGDYLDPYEEEGITPEKAFKELQDIIEFKRKHPENVTLLLGNHDLGYLEPAICTVRQDERKKARNRKLLLDNIELFDIVSEGRFSEQKILFSHAGLRTTWLRHNDWLFDTKNFHPSEINELFHDEEGRKDLFISLADVSIFRGGFDKSGSVVWTDIEEFIYNNDELPGYIQIFGHTLHTGGAWVIDKHLWCLDCGKAFKVKPSADKSGIEIKEL
jgi:hypothetical protein